jgi:alpha-beta hydrolase superfamily lysophospholipase
MSKTWWGKWALRLVGAAFAAVFGLILLYALHARFSLAPLSRWHRLELKSEFHAGRTDVTTFEDYKRLEDRLFAEMRERLDPAADPSIIGRYHAGSASQQLADNQYNRSYELSPGLSRGAVLLVHGLSDSPYSMRAMAETFYEQGYDVVVLRLPGHGTTPSMLRYVTWKDWYAAVELAAKYTAEKAGGKAFLAGGHSTGAALLTLYAERALRDPSLPKPLRLYLVSPAIGISPFAFLTGMFPALSFMPAFENSAWMDVLPEYDPYKFNSFPMNAANQIYKLTSVLHEELTDAYEQKRLGEFPHVIVFQSIVDATVSASQVVQGLLALLPDNGHELVVFDVNRFQSLQALIAPGPMEYLEKLRAESDAPFRITLIGNRDAMSLDMAAYTRPAGTKETFVADLPLAWPKGVFSLGHVAIPFPVDDPVYGLDPKMTEGPRFGLGAFSARGESGALVISAGVLSRIRCNPFFDVIRSKIAETCR